MTRVLIIFMLVCAFAAIATPAGAHAMLMSSDPPAGARVARAPGAVTLTFDEAVETALGSLRVFDALGNAHAAGAVVHPAGDGRRISVGLTNMARGRYVVAWQVVSADSHMMSGAFAFGVDVDAGAAPRAPVSGNTGWVLPAVHFVLLASALLGIGLPIGGAALAGSARQVPLRIERLAWIVLAIVAFADLGLRAALAGSTLFAALATHVGVLRIVTALAALLGLAALAGRARRLALLGPAAIATIVSLSLAGHAAAGAAAPLGVAADAVHFVAAATWIGVLAVALRLGAVPELERITPFAASAVGLLIVTGIVQTLRDAGSLAALVVTAYGHVIDVKIALLIGLLVIALTAQRALKRGSVAIGARIRLELVVLTAVIAATAVLIEMPLPRETAAAQTIVGTTLTVRTTHVRVSAAPLDARTWTIHIVADGPIDAAASLTEPHRHIGPLAIGLTAAGKNAYSGTFSLPFAGAWQLLASASSGAFDEAHRTFALPEEDP